MCVFLQETMELAYNKSKPVAVTGMAFPMGDVNNYVVGSEEGIVYTASRHGRFVNTHISYAAEKDKCRYNRYKERSST